MSDKYEKAVADIIGIVTEKKGCGILPEAESDINAVQVKPTVQLLSYTIAPLETVTIAAKRCYSPLSNEDLIRQVLDVSDEENGRFINSVMKTGHMSTIEHVSFSFIVGGVSRALLAQATRSRIASFSVQSQRYVEMDDGMTYIMPPSIEALGDEAMAEYAAQMCTMHQWYKGWRDKGIEPEDARFVSPQAAETRYILTMNARELFHLFSLRSCERAQWEIREVADMMLEICQMVSPEIFKTAGPSCVQTGKCPEGKRSCGKAAEMKAEYADNYKTNKQIHDALGFDYIPEAQRDDDNAA